MQVLSDGLPGQGFALLFLGADTRGLDSLLKKLCLCSFYLASGVLSLCQPLVD